MVFLWIITPLIVVFLMVAGYIQNRRRKAQEAEDSLSPEFEVAEDRSTEPGKTPVVGEKAYQGLLWLKAKYEEDIEHADTRFYELREEFKKLEKNYIDLRVHSISLEQQIHTLNLAMPGVSHDHADSLAHEDSNVYENSILHERSNAFEGSGSQGNLQEDESLPGETDQKSHEYKEREDEEREIETQGELLFLNNRLDAEIEKVKSLEARLASSSKLLMKMYKELAGTLEASNSFYKSKAHENRVKGLVKEFDVVSAAPPPSVTEERKISSWVESPAVEEDGQLGQLG